MNKKVLKIPVVVILGHIDHGKTSILDYIRKAHITEQESGGITQHVGAYEIDFEGKKITFIDTPGHEAFSEMRARGAKIADIAILVVAAEEGIKPQTKEAIKAVKEAKISMIVALNKIDKAEADPRKVKEELQREEVSIEEWGGDVPVIETSAKTGKGIKDLLSMINLVAHVSELKADQEGKAKGTIIESCIDSLRGPTATLILREGRLKAGDVIRTDTAFGKIRNLEDFQLQQKQEVLPGEVCVVTGFTKVPEIGESFNLADSVVYAKKEIEKIKTEKLSDEPRAAEEPKQEIEKFLNVVLKADVRGTLEVISKILSDLREDKIGIKILKKGIGEITDSDVRMAESEKGVIIGFRTKLSVAAESLDKKDQKGILIFNVIYDLIDNVRKLMVAKKESKMTKVELGKMKTLVIFKTKKRGEKNYRQVVGGKVIEGEVKKRQLEIVRDEAVLAGGKIMEMQEEKRKIEKAKVNQEIGILYEGKTKIKEGDKLIIFEVVET